MDTEKQKYMQEFQKRAVACAESVYTKRLTDPVDMEYVICCTAIDEADAQFPPDEEGNRPPQWSQVKNAFISLVEQVISVKATRKDIL